MAEFSELYRLWKFYCLLDFLFCEEALNPQSQVILVVDDDEITRCSVEAMLRRRGYSPITAAGPFQGLREARDFLGEIHLLLTAVVMPEMSGVALAQRLVAERPNIRVLLMSGYNDLPPYGLPLLRKPFRINHLLDTVRNGIDGLPPSAYNVFTEFTDSSKAHRVTTLKRALDAARQRYLDAAREFNTAMKTAPSESVHPEGVMRIQSLRNIVDQAFEVFQRARKALADEQAKGD